MSNWIDFKALRKGLSFEEVLKHYDVAIKRRNGNRHVGFCPLPTHQGKRKSPSFSAKLDVGVWQCFGCRASGNVLDFAVRMEGGDPQDPQDLRRISLKLRDVFRVNCSRSQVPAPATKTPTKPTPSPSATVVINAPLDFELRGLDYDHPYLVQRGFTPETIRHFGLGFCNRGLMKNRIAIPLHNLAGHLIGYAGRIADDSLINESTPKYLLPKPRTRNSERYEFHKSLVLYNAHRILKPVDHLFVVEGFPSTWWLWQLDYRNVVALMGSACSKEQGELIVKLVRPDGKVWLLPDGNNAGALCAISALEQIAPRRFTRWVQLQPEDQPTDLQLADLLELIKS